jgi:hypothetical protein
MHVPRGVPALALLIFSTVCGTACTRGPFFTFGSVLGVCIMYQITCPVCALPCPES